jgi:hypothetical protein
VGVVNTRDELTQRQRLLLVIDLHGMNIGQETARAPWGIYPPEVLVSLRLPWAIICRAYSPFILHSTSNFGSPAGPRHCHHSPKRRINQVFTTWVSNA